MHAAPLAPELQARIRAELEHPFDLMIEAVEFRFDQIREMDVRHYDLVPVAEYQKIRIYVSDLARLRGFLDGDGPAMTYVSFIGNQRQGTEAVIEATDRALIGRSPTASPVVGYFSLQDPQLAWVNLVLFEDDETLASWVAGTRHADDWSRAAAMFSGIEKSLGSIQVVDGCVRLDPHRFMVRDYDALSA